MGSRAVAMVVGVGLLFGSSACGGRTSDLPSTDPRPEPGSSSPTDPPAGGPASPAPTSPQLGARPNDRDGRYAWLKTAIIGSWSGVRTTPWDAAVEVAISFEAAGTYRSRCLAGGTCQVWYYGIDDDAPGRTYSLEDVGTNLKATGTLAIPFTLDGKDVQEGRIERVDIDETATTLTFDFYATWGGGRYGPVHFDLKRTSP